MVSYILATCWHLCYCYLLVSLPPASCLLPPEACLLPPASCLLPPVHCFLFQVGGRRVVYNNQPVETLMDLTRDSILASESVWFGCEVSKR